MKAGSGYSTANDSQTAVLEALEMALDVGADQPAILFVFITDRYDPEAVVSALNQKLDGVPFAGMCAAGILYGNQVYTSGVAILALHGEELEAQTVLSSGLNKNPFDVGKFTADKILANGHEDGIVAVFPDGFSSNIAEMLRGLYMNMGPSFQYIGGGAGDNLKFYKTYQFTEQGVATDAVAAAMIRGIPVNISLGHGWESYGEPIMVTRAEGKRVYEIDGKPAFDAYKDRFEGVTIDSFSSVGMKHPLGFIDVNGHYYIRDPLSVNPDDNSINCVSEVPPNAIGNIMKGEVSQLINTARSVCINAKKTSKNPSFALICDCISRYLLMADEFEAELETFREVIGDDVPVVGALTFGEVGSVENAPFFHNKTLVLAIG